MISNAHEVNLCYVKNTSEVEWRSTQKKNQTRKDSARIPGSFDLSMLFDLVNSQLSTFSVICVGAAGKSQKYTQFFPSLCNKMADFTFDLEIIVRYYMTVLWIPVLSSEIWKPLNFSDLHFRFLLHWFTFGKICFYLLPRLLCLVSFIQTLCLIIEASYEYQTTGQIEIFGFLGLILWLGFFNPFYCTDNLLLNPSAYFLQPINTLRRIFTKAQNHLDNETLSHLKSMKTFKVWGLVIHNAILDYQLIINFGLTTFQDFELDMAQLRAVIPWRTSLGNGAYWCAQQILMTTTIMAWSTMLTLPGVIAYHFECTIKILAKSVDNGPIQRYSLDNIVNDYKCLQTAIRILSEKGVSRFLLVFYICLAVTLSHTACFD